jgi:hypothetical protein
MSDYNWEESGKHPPASVLLLHLEQELGSREAAAVERHAAQCWECRAECDRLQRGIVGFIEYRDAVLLPGVPPPPPARNKAYQRLQAEASRPISWFALALRSLRMHSERRWPWAAAATLAIIAAFMIAPKVLSPPLGGPAVVNAAGFLHHAITSAGPLSPGPGTQVYQKIEIRQGNRVVQQEILRGGKRKTAADHPANLPNLQPVDWSDPLGAGQFAAWRDSIARKRDSIEQSGATVTLRTAPLLPAEIAGASLTVRQSDWHTIAKRVEMRDGPVLEIREVAYEVRSVPDASPETVASLDATVSPHQQRLPAPQTGNSDDQMEDAELDLREAFHRIGADVQEAPRIWRENRSIRFSAWVESESRAAQLRRAASTVPYARAEIHLPEVSTADQPERFTPTTPSALPAFVTRPPLAEHLWTTMGGMENANRYLGELGKAYVDLFASASSLARHAERYPERERGRFNAATWQRVEFLAAEQMGGVRSLSRRYIEILSPVLMEMLAKEGVVPPPVAEATDCSEWQTLAPAIAADASSLHVSFRRLFVQEQMDRPVSFQAAELLRQSAASRASLINHVGQLCAQGNATR